MENDTRLYKWVQSSIDGLGVTGCMLLQPPFEQVVVEFGGEVEIYEHGVTFKWRVIDNPNNIDNLTTENTEFTKYLQRVVFDRIDEAKGVSSDDEEEGKGSSVG